MKTTIKTFGASLLFVGAMMCFMAPAKAQDVQNEMMKFGRLLRLIDSYYVDTVNVSKLTENAIVEVLKQLDPHSVYISKEEVDKMNEPLQGSFEGIGISFNIYKDTLMVLSTVPGGPSEKVGLRAGDRIVNVDGKNIVGIGLKNTDVYDMLRGQKGTKVALKILRKNEPALLEFTIIRDKIPINSLDASYMLNNSTGYIKLNRFSATTSDEFLEAIRKLKAGNSMKNLVLDLRGNGGGYLTAAIDLADQFLSAYKMIVYTEGIHADRKEYKATALGEFEQGKLVVLIDEGSASASEIVTGAVQDWDRGIVIGRRSYGKGLVQQPYYLTDGSMVRLTTAHYYTPSGRCIQKPYEEGVDEYRKDYQKRFEHGELFSKDSIAVNKEKKYTTMVSKRNVYGGGGILPDIFVPMDTSKYYNYYNQLNRKNVVYTQALGFIDKNRDDIKAKYSDFGAFKSKFEIPEALIDRIVAEGEKEGIAKNQASLDFARPLMKRQIKALVARDLFSVSHYYEIMNEDDTTIQKALDVLKQNGAYEKILVDKL